MFGEINNKWKTVSLAATDLKVCKLEYWAICNPIEALTSVSDDHAFENKLPFRLGSSAKADSPRIKLAVAVDMADSTKLKRYYINRIYI